MATLFHGALTTVDSTKKVATGTKVMAVDSSTGEEKEYIYLKGVASTAAGDVVCINHDGTDYTTARLTEALAAEKVPMAVALAAIVADKYGWYQIKGTAEVAFGAAAVAGKKLAAHATAGSLDDTGTTYLDGIYLIDTVTGAGNFTCLLFYPHS